MKNFLKSVWSIIAVCLCACAGLAAGSAWADTFPSKAVKIVVPFPPGGGVDLVARVIGQQVSVQMGQPVVIENKPGAGANIGADFVAKADPDGYTILCAANGLAANVTLFPNTPFNALRDFAPIAKVGSAPLMVIVSKDSPAKTLKDLIAMASKEPGKLAYGSAGNGSSQHLGGEMFKTAAKIDVLHVPYKGGHPAMNELLGGRISYMVQNPLEAISLVKGNQLRALAVAGNKRMALLPDVPTAAEAGLPGYEAPVWWGFVAPVKTPKEVVARLNAEIVKALAAPKVKEQFTQMGVVIEAGTPEQFGKFLHTEVETLANVIKTAGIRAD